MNQFIAAWEFSLKNFQYLFLLVLPVMVSEIVVAYLLIPVNGMEDPIDILEYISGNTNSLGLASLVALILSVSLTGGLRLGYQSVLTRKGIPIDCLFGGIKKFFPLLGASILATLLIGLGAILLILPAFYFMGRVYLAPAYIVFEDKGVFESLRSSWDATDAHGTTLFFLTFVFFVLTAAAGGIVTFLVFEVSPVAATIGAGLIEYIFLLPWIYIYFSLYKSIKS